MKQWLHRRQVKHAIHIGKSTCLLSTWNDAMICPIGETLFLQNQISIPTSDLADGLDLASMVASQIPTDPTQDFPSGAESSSIDRAVYG